MSDETWGYELVCPCGVKCWSYTWSGIAWSFADHVRREHPVQPRGIHEQTDLTPTPKAYKLTRQEDQ